MGQVEFCVRKFVEIVVSMWRAEWKVDGDGGGNEPGLPERVPCNMGGALLEFGEQRHIPLDRAIHECCQCQDGQRRTGQTNYFRVRLETGLNSLRQKT